MESSLWIQTPKHKKINNEGEDRLSSLPDELLTRIISFLPVTKGAIRTSILAKRWKYLWTCIPNHKFVYAQELPWGAGAKYRRFINNVDRLCHLRHGDGQLSIEKFSVSSTYKTEDNPNVDSWISFLISRNIKKIVLKLSISLVCQLPTCLFTCKTLVYLKLAGKFKLNLPTTSSLFLPNLLTLKLESVKYTNDETVSRLLSGCPILEELVVERYTSPDDVEILHIAVPSLKRLVLYFQPGEETGDFGTIIDTPNLEYLSILDVGSQFIFLQHTSSLVEAYVDIVDLTERPVEFGGLVTSLIGVLLLAISDVKILSLCGYTISYLCHHYNHHLPKFSNVEHLVLDMIQAHSWDFLPNMLDGMPKLQELVFEVLKELDDNVTTKFEWSPPEDVPVCLSFHLKTIEIRNFYGGEDELKLVKYFLENGKVLEMMTIRLCIESQDFVQDKWFESQEELLKSQLGSGVCRLNFID